MVSSDGPNRTSSPGEAQLNFLTASGVANFAEGGLWNKSGSRSSRRGKEAEDPLGRGLADMKPPVGRQFGDAPRDGAAIPERPAFSRLHDRLATLLDQGTAIFVATTGDRVPIMSKGG
jgi:hypothetical protein